MSMKSINEIVNAILADTNNKIGEALIHRANVINNLFDDAYGSCLGGYYASGMECAAAGLRRLDDLITYAAGARDTVSGPVWESVRDALGSVCVDKAPLQREIIAEYKIRIKRIVSPNFGE